MPTRKIKLELTENEIDLAIYWLEQSIFGDGDSEDKKINKLIVKLKGAK